MTITAPDKLKNVSVGDRIDAVDNYRGQNYIIHGRVTRKNTFPSGSVSVLLDNGKDLFADGDTKVFIHKGIF